MLVNGLSASGGTGLDGVGGASMGRVSSGTWLMLFKLATYITVSERLTKVWEQLTWRDVVGCFCSSRLGSA